MKKIFFLLLVPVFLLFCGFIAPNNREFEYKYITPFNYDVYSDNPFFFILDDSYKFENYYYLWTYGSYEGRFVLVCLQSVAYQTSCGFTYLYDQDGIYQESGATASLSFASCWRYGTDTPSSYNTFSGIPDSNSLTFTSLQDAYNYFYFSSIPQYYSSTIPAPDCDIYSADINIAQDPIVPVDLEFRNNNNYKMRVLCRFYNVTAYDCGYTSDSSPFSISMPYYNPSSRNKSEIYTVFGIDEFQDVRSLVPYDFTHFWRDYINEWFSDNAIVFNADRPMITSKFDVIKGIVAGGYNSSIGVYNITEIWVQYYTINNGVLYYGDITHWVNKPSNLIHPEWDSDSEIPAIVNTYNPDFYDGITDPSINTLNPIGKNVGVGNDGSGGYVSNVPNYPDYPTIASYNHDNILVQFLQTASYLPQFFGDFSSFCTTSFSFMPEFIWQIIAFGFLGSIVIMIIKIL